MKPLTIILLCLIIFNVTNGNFEYETLEGDPNSEIYRKYDEFDKELKQLAGKSVKMILPYVMEAREHTNLSTTCTRNVFELINGFRKLKTWSIKILDAAGKIPAGILSGNFYMGGEYDQCASTTVLKSNGEINFQGKYCMIELIPPLPVMKRKPSLWDKVEGIIKSTRNSSDIVKHFAALANYFYISNLKFAICVPSGCSDQDVSQMMNYVLEKVYTRAIVQSCLKEGDIRYWTPFRTFSVVIMSLLAVLVIIATAFDHITKNETNSGIIVKILKCFSIVRNFPKMASLKSTNETLAFLNGMRTLSIFWVILCHEYFVYGMTLTGTHLLSYKDVVGSFFIQIVFTGFYSVDTFFFISGFLNSYLRTQLQIKGKNQPTFLQIMLHRLWRIYPTLIFAHFVYYILNMPSPNSYTTTKQLIDNCENYWWMSFVFINNFFKMENMCLPQTWYLCADMQLFLLSLFVVPVLLKNPRKGYTLSIVLIIAGHVSVMIWHYINNLPPTWDATRLYRSEMIETIQEYINPLSHFGPYFIGIIIGHAMAFDKDIKISKLFRGYKETPSSVQQKETYWVADNRLYLHRLHVLYPVIQHLSFAFMKELPCSLETAVCMKIQVIGWLFSTFLAMSAIFIPIRWHSGTSYTDFERVLFGSFSKTVYILSLSWIVFCCKLGYGGIINYFLSLKIWFPLAKMTFTLYLVSPLIQIYYRGNINFPVDFSTISIVWSYLGTMFVSILLSLVLVLMIESPFITLEKLLFRRLREDIDKPSSKEDSNMNKLTDNLQNGLQRNEYEVAHL